MKNIKKINVYTNKNDREKYLKRYFTEEGIKSLERRLKELAKLYVEIKTYPFKAMLLGFPSLIIRSKEQHQGMMEELREILGLEKIKFEVNT